MFEFLSLFLSVLVCYRYLRVPEPPPRPPWENANLNQAIDEWNAREMEEESESFYE